MSAGPNWELEEQALFRGAPEAFVEARNQLARRARAAGDRAGSDRIKALARPSAVAWAVNQLHWRGLGYWQQLEAAQAQVSAALASGRNVPEALAGRRAVLRAATDAALELLQAAGHAAGPAVVRDLGATLEALGQHAGRRGCLSAALAAPGFDGMAAFAASLPQAPAAPHARPLLTVIAGGQGGPRALAALPSARTPDAHPEGADSRDAHPAGADPEAARAQEERRLEEARREAQRRLEEARREAEAQQRAARERLRAADEAHRMALAGADVARRTRDAALAEVQRLEQQLAGARARHADAEARFEAAEREREDAAGRREAAERRAQEVDARVLEARVAAGDPPASPSLGDGAAD